jgi:hypothetical protein
MDQARRERIRELIRVLESTQGQIHDLWVEEEIEFDSRSAPSKETRSGQDSKGAVEDLEQATYLIQDAIEAMQSAIGPASEPAP